MARKQKYRREVWRKCPKSGMIVSPEVCSECDERYRCEAEEVERKVRRKV